MNGALGTFLARSAKKEDLAVIFYAGHGAPKIDPRDQSPTVARSTWRRATRIQ